MFLIWLYIIIIDSGILRFTIHEVKGLSGKPSPYARVLVNGTEKIKTKAMKKNASPKFEKFVEVLVIDKTEVQMRVQIQDSTNFAADVELGSWSSSLLTIFDKIEKNEGWWDLTHNGKNSGRVRISALWKPVVMTGLAESLGGHGIYRKYFFFFFYKEGSNSVLHFYTFLN